MHFTIDEARALEELRVGIGVDARHDGSFLATAKDRASGQTIATAEGRSELQAARACYVKVKAAGNPHALAASSVTLKTATDQHKQNERRFARKQ